MRRFALTYVVDDDEIFVFVLRKLLEKSDHFDEVINIGNGSEAIEMLNNQYHKNGQLPELIFLDLNMPILDGWHFLDAIEQLEFKDRLEIHVISSSIDTREIEKAKAYPAVKSFVSKPVTLNWLNSLA